MSQWPGTDNDSRSVLWRIHAAMVDIRSAHVRQWPHGLDITWVLETHDLAPLSRAVRQASRSRQTSASSATGGYWVNKNGPRKARLGEVRAMVDFLTEALGE